MLHERTDPQPAILTVAEVALYLRVSETTVWRWCSRGKLPAFRIGRSWRLHRDDLETLIARHSPVAHEQGDAAAQYSAAQIG